MKLTLTKEEKKLLYRNKSIVIEKKLYMPTPNKSIIHGHGYGTLWDKVDQVWVYGDIENYIQKMMNVGRRNEDYKDNTINVWSGSHWYNFNKNIEEFGVIGQEVISGRKDILKFKIKNISVSELRDIPEHIYKCKHVIMKFSLVCE